jgi:hypothetical protein
MDLARVLYRKKQKMIQQEIEKERSIFYSNIQNRTTVNIDDEIEESIPTQREIQNVKEQLEIIEKAFSI